MLLVGNEIEQPGDILVEKIDEPADPAAQRYLVAGKPVKHPQCAPLGGGMLCRWG